MYTMSTAPNASHILRGFVASLALACASEPHGAESAGEESGTSGADTGEDPAPTTDPGTSGTTHATGEATSEEPTTGEVTTGGEAPAIPFACPGAEIGPGWNSVVVGDAERTFIADLPASLDRPMGVLFSWHGYGDSAENFRSVLDFDPDADPARPMVVITPEDSGLPPPIGLDWDLARGTEADENVDLDLFEAVLGCLDAQFEVDPARIYSFGFSAGAVMTNLLHSRYPRLVSTIITASGAWFNDQAEADLVKLFAIDWNWPALDPADGGTVLLTHGGPTDVTVLNILDLEASAQAALPFLAAGGRLVVDCAHTQGHTLHPEVPPELMSAFVSAHRAGESSPYANGLDGFPPSCELRLP
jgi:predicted esterase